MKRLEAPVRIAIAGLGDVAFQHKRAIDMCEEAIIAGIWTRNGEKLAKLSREWNITAYHGFDAILADNAVHVVDITAADEVHFDFAMRALAAGKHVIVEKPPALHSGQVQELITAADNAGLLCVPMHNYVYRPRLVQARNLIDRNELGMLTYGFFSEVMHMDEQWAGHYHGVLVTAMYHLIYASLFLMGMPDRVFAQQESIHYSQCNDDDLTNVLLHYPGGAMATLLGNWTSDDLTANSWFSMYKLIGMKGGINISGHDALVYEESGWGSLRWPDYEDSFVHSIDYIVRKCLIDGSPPLSGLDDAALTMRIIELAQQSSLENRAIPFE